MKSVWDQSNPRPVTPNEARLGKPRSVKPNQTKSNLIKVNQTYEKTKIRRLREIHASQPKKTFAANEHSATKPLYFFGVATQKRQTAPFVLRASSGALALNCTRRTEG
jgi:hypothetical protein